MARGPYVKPAPPSTLAWALLAACYGEAPAPPPIDCSAAFADDLYARRVAPLVSGERPSSCNQCHLAGVDLSMFVRESPCASMACLVEKGEVDLDLPEASLVLERILKADPASGLIDAGVVAEEHDGFLAWIGWSAACHAETCGDVPDPCGAAASPARPGVVPTPLGSCQEEDLAQVFEDRVYRWKKRCDHCHIVCEEDYLAPCWLDLSFEDGDAAGESAASTRTMYNLLGLGVVDVEDPPESLLLLKPLSEAAGGVPHGGGAKFTDRVDPTYQDFLVWIEHYAACWQGEAPVKPVVDVSSPVNNHKYDPSKPLVLEGGALDPQEGPLGGASLVWTTDQVATPLGTGPGPLDVTLAAGDHVLTLTATDADGHTGRRQLRVRMKVPKKP